MGDITLGISPACHLKIFLSFLLNCFSLPALVALLLTRWLVACTNRGMLVAILPSTPPLPLNKVLILPDGDYEIIRRMFERFEEVARAGGIRLLSPSICVVIKDTTSDK